MPITKAIKVLIVEDHPLFSKGLVSLIGSTGDYTVVGEAATLAEAMSIAKSENPALAIVDINLGDENGMDIIPRLKVWNPNIVILVLSMYDERYYTERILRLGARGYIMKDEAGSKVLDAIETVMSGKVYLSGAEKERILEAMTGENLKDSKNWALSVRKLSDRELQIFSLMGKGLGTIEIANKFNLSTKTIDTHKEHIKLKFHCNTSQELRQLAVEWASHPGNP
ncbi:MAG: response regulator transcription factor [Spirochaetaceae bacterium]|jgi:DNA-binding NarL/FixJ family response regulator|nr:response regulator transcription factor [Spirochaetaceae bacterium]